MSRFERKVVMTYHSLFLGMFHRHCALHAAGYRTSTKIHCKRYTTRHHLSLQPMATGLHSISRHSLATVCWRVLCRYSRDECFSQRVTASPCSEAETSSRRISAEMSIRPSLWKAVRKDESPNMVLSPERQMMRAKRQAP